MGGMFFQEFFGVFTNSYAESPATQSIKLYVGQNQLYSSSYIGTEILPTGTNPFNPNTPDGPTDSVSWIWILVLGIVCLFLVSGLIFACYKWKAT